MFWLLSIGYYSMQSCSDYKCFKVSAASTFGTEACRQAEKLYVKGGKCVKEIEALREENYK